MRATILALAILFALTPYASVVSLPKASSPGGSAPPFGSATRETATFPVTSSSEFVLEPADGEWLQFSPSSIEIRLLNSSLGIAPEQSTLRLNGEPLAVTWSDSTSTVAAVVDGRLADGIHAVQAHLVHRDASLTELAWSFGLDTLVPHVDVDPLPPTTSNLAVEIHGRARDAWLLGVTILGRDVPSDNGNFTVEIRLWPGLNDIVVEARDLAGNLGRLSLVVILETPAFEGPANHLVVENTYFAIDIPEGWVAQEGVRLPSGNQADLVAVGPLQPGLETSVIVTSDRTSYLYSDTRALEWMDLVLASVASSGQLKQVVSRPRIPEDHPGTVAVQSTFLRQTASTQVAFMQVTMVWSRLLRIQWVILASMDERRAVEMWAAVNATASSFQVLDEGLGEPGIPASTFITLTAVVAGAIVVLLAIATYALLPTFLAWRRAKGRARWRPPRNWRL